MSKLVLHPGTANQLEAFGRKPSHALILVGPIGSGKFAVATQLAEKILQLEADSFVKYAYGIVIRAEDDKSSIGIEAIRQLEHFLSLKVPRSGPHTRAVIIENAHFLTLEAQNALLKTLEEPPDGTIMLLTTSHEQALLPTIRSRAQLINVLRPDREAVEAYFSGRDLESKQLRQAYDISGGRPGMMAALIGEDDHPLRSATQKARELLSQTSYQRLLEVDVLAKQRLLAADTIFILQQMAHLGLASKHATSKWQSILEASYNAADALDTNAQPKLALTDLMLKL